MNAAQFFRVVRVFLLVAGAVVPLSSAAQESAPILVRLWPEGCMPGQGAPEPEGTMISENDGKPRIINVSDPTLAVYPADEADAPALVVCPGGGYRWLAYDKEGVEIASWLNSKGITALVLKYRVPDNRDGALMDLQRALRLARANAAAWHLDPKRLGAIGFSAGGNLVARASLAPKSRYKNLDGIDRESARPDFAVLVYAAFLEPDGRLHPDLTLSDSAPPLLLIANRDDKMCFPSTRVFTTALSKKKIEFECMVYPTGGHGHGLHSTGASAAWPDFMLQWLDRRGLYTNKSAAKAADSEK